MELLIHGLEVKVVGVLVVPPWNGDRLLVLQLEGDTARTDADRGYPLHISLRLVSELTPDIWAGICKIAKEWAGRRVRLDFDYLRDNVLRVDRYHPLARALHGTRAVSWRREVQIAV